MDNMNKYYKYYIIALLVVVIDQTSKMLVYYNMDLGTFGEVNVLGDWFKLHYLLNPGMAFGLRWDWEYGKLALSLFRVLAMFGIGYYLYSLAKKGVHTGLLISMGMILGGAIGNVIDSTFYGVLLNNAPAGSLTQWFHGQVIDMLFFPLFDGYYPDWAPMVGGNYFLFFSPVFNIADSSIFIGVVLILVMQKRFFAHSGESEKREDSEANSVSVQQRQ